MGAALPEPRQKAAELDRVAETLLVVHDDRLAGEILAFPARNAAVPHRVLLQLVPARLVRDQPFAKLPRSEQGDPEIAADAAFLRRQCKSIAKALDGMIWPAGGDPRQPEVVPQPGEAEMVDLFARPFAFIGDADRLHDGDRGF